MEKERKFKLDYLGIGTEKSGTTWLAECLREHPEVFIPKEKELFFFNEFDPHFFSISNKKYERGIAWYKGKFKNAKNGQLLGEYSPTYFYSEVTAKRIKKHFPNVKLILIFRDPVRRAFSQYVFDKSLGVIRNMSFEKALKGNNSYLEKGKYAKYFKVYLKYFSRKNILVLLNEDIKNSPEEACKKLYKFLKVRDTDFKPSCLYKKVYPATEARFAFINAFLVKTQYLLGRKKFEWLLKMIERSGLRDLAVYIKESNVKPLNKYPSMEKSTEKYLRNIFNNETTELEKMLKVDLTQWKRL